MVSAVHELTAQYSRSASATDDIMGGERDGQLQRDERAVAATIRKHNHVPYSLRVWHGKDCDSSV